MLLESERRNLVEATMSKCPFLNKLSGSFLKKYSSILIKNYSAYCPVMATIGRKYSNLTLDGAGSKNGKYIMTFDHCQQVSLRSVLSFSWFLTNILFAQIKMMVTNYNKRANYLVHFWSQSSLTSPKRHQKWLKIFKRKKWRLLKVS